MKISILLPYKENFSPQYPGAVSLFINSMNKLSIYKKEITVYGSTDLKEKFSDNYINIQLKKSFLKSQTRDYVNKFVELHKNQNTDIIEIHNRPNYVEFLKSLNSKKVLYFHNDPLTMTGSKSLTDRNFLLNYASKIVFNSQWSKKRFLEGFESSYANSEKLLVIYQSADKPMINFKKKKKWITFVGKLNTAKGYDLFGKAILKILKNFKNWYGVVVGDEPRQKLFYNHPRLKKLGFINK